MLASEAWTCSVSEGRAISVHGPYVSVMGGFGAKCACSWKTSVVYALGQVLWHSLGAEQHSAPRHAQVHLLLPRALQWFGRLRGWIVCGDANTGCWQPSAGHPECLLASGWMLSGFVPARRHCNPARDSLSLFSRLQSRFAQLFAAGKAAGVS